MAIKANEVSGGTIKQRGLKVAVALRVAIGLSLGTFKIVTGTPLHFYILPGYLVVIIQTFFAPKNIIPRAYDSGCVTTSTVTVPIVTALGLDLSLEAQTDIILFLTEQHTVKNILAAINHAGEFHKPGTGIAFVLPIEQAIGLNSQMERFEEERNQQEP